MYFRIGHIRWMGIFNGFLTMGSYMFTLSDFKGRQILKEEILEPWEIGQELGGN